MNRSQLAWRLLTLAVLALSLNFGRNPVFTQEKKETPTSPEKRLQPLRRTVPIPVSPLTGSARGGAVETAAAPPAESAPAAAGQEIAYVQVEIHPSAFEKQLLAYIDPKEDRPILQFGYEVFDRPQPALFDIPVGSDYVLGTDDTIVLSLWGSIDLDYRVTIDREGQVRLPYVGPVPLKALTLARAEDVLKQKFDQQFKNYQLQLRLGRLRDMPVHVIGRAVLPGRVRVPSVATLFDALSAAGGVTKDGTLRKLVLRRLNENDRAIDLYRYLLEGDRAVDVGLKPNDVVVIPAVGPQVAIIGQVQRPGIYELDAAEINFDILLGMAGGYTRLADRKQAQVESAGPNGLSIRTVELDSTPPNRVRLQSGDVVVVRAASPKLENVVYLSGNVTAPGRYAYRPGMRVSDLVTEETLVEAGFWLKRQPPGQAAPDQNLPEPFLEYALIRRINPHTFQESRIAFHLGKAIFESDPAENHPLQPQDTVIVFPKSAFEAPQMVFITGAVNKPGLIPYQPGMTARDLIRMAGGLLQEAHLSSGLLTRIHPDQDKARFEHIPIDLKAALAGDEKANLLLQRDDSLAVKVVPEFRKLLRIDIEGEVRQPGTYTAIPGERLSDLLKRAGGFTPDAYLPAAQFYRESVRKLQQER
ncbi:MAG: SLBB domain-containing protein, partial [Planctomycetes bacterium]|nr:SLBB domain-containing protein [Planctomycetota bacterium]